MVLKETEALFIMNRKLDQYFTPAWIASRIVETYFPDLSHGQCVLEPCCGEGRFLQALPSGVQGVGVEIDPVAAAAAARRTSSQIIVGDIRDVVFDREHFQAVIGNPPFRTALIDDVLARSKELLVDGGRAGMILPAYTFQTPSRVCRYARDWTIQTDNLPRTLFPGLSKPLVFAVFTKEKDTRLIGFAFYEETLAIKSLKARYQQILEASSGSVWRSVVAQALFSLGGQARLDQIYSEIEGRRPTENNEWKAQVRKVLQSRFVRVAPSEYALDDASAALAA